VTTARSDAAAPGRVGAFLRLVKVEHSVFALPFAYVAALTAMNATDGRVDGWTLLLITIAMVGARTFAMAANRVIDREIDARNPRTKDREIVTGVVSVRTAWTGALIALAVFLAAAAALNPLCLALAPLAVVPLIVYPYAKRFTDFPQVVLGVAQAVAPIGAWVAVTGTFGGPVDAWPAFWLGLAVGTWIGGFDLIYACQDADVDRVIGVRSVPARFGVARALLAARLTHVVTFALFVVFGVTAHANAWWYAGLAVTAAAFVYEHRLVRADDLSHVNKAFFTVNGFVGIALFGFALAGLVAAGMGV
jgi:4-hydroxybenzoate polyprenyltransferase